MSDYGVDLSGPIVLACLIIIALVICLWVWAPLSAALIVTGIVGIPSMACLGYALTGRYLK